MSQNKLNVIYDNGNQKLELDYTSLEQTTKDLLDFKLKNPTIPAKVVIPNKAPDNTLKSLKGIILGFQFEFEESKMRDWIKQSSADLRTPESMLKKLDKFDEGSVAKYNQLLDLGDTFVDFGKQLIKEGILHDRCEIQIVIKNKESYKIPRTQKEATK